MEGPLLSTMSQRGKQGVEQSGQLWPCAGQESGAGGHPRVSGRQVGATVTSFLDSLLEKASDSGQGSSCKESQKAREGRPLMLGSIKEKLPPTKGEGDLALLLGWVTHRLTPPRDHL